jgi:hypothetical protein
MNNLSLDIILLICDYLNSYEIERLFRISKYMYNLYKSSSIKRVYNDKQLKQAFIDPYCDTVLIFKDFLHFDNTDNKKEEYELEIPNKSLHIIGAGTNIALKLKQRNSSGKYFNLRLSYLTPYVLHIDCPTWNIYINNCHYDNSCQPSNSLSASSISLVDVSLPLGSRERSRKIKKNLKANKEINLDIIYNFKEPEMCQEECWSLEAPLIKINNYHALCTELNIKANKYIEKNCNFKRLVEKNITTEEGVSH